MRDWNTSVLIAFGFVLGATVMLVAAPYFMAVELIEGTNRVSGLLTGYGDIYASIVTGTMALAAGYYLWRIQENKKDKAEAKLLAVHASRILDPARDLLVSFEMIRELIGTDEKRPNTITYCQNMSKLWTAYTDDLEKEKPDPILGRKVDDTYRSTIGRVRTIIQGAQMLHDALGDNLVKDDGVDRSFYNQFNHGYVLLKVLNQRLNKLIDADQD